MRNALLLGAITGILTLFCTYIFGMIHHGFYFASVYLKWWIMCLSVVPPLLFLTVTTFRINKNIRYILISSITSGIAFMICGWFVLAYKLPITSMFYYYFFPTDVFHPMIGFSYNSNILNAGIFLVVIIFSYLIVIQKKRVSN
jgi:hypothetical protein